MKYLILIIAGVVGVWVGHKLAMIRKKASKKENKQKIAEFLKIQNRITNSDVEKLLGVSDATATRYLDEFEKEGKLKQIHPTGKHVYYETRK